MSQIDFLITGLVLSFLLTFILSFLQVIFSYYSRIGFSRILEGKDSLKNEILEHFDELKIAIDYGRITFYLALVVYTCLLFPALSGWPLWCFLLFLALYLVVFDYLPRLLLLAIKEKNLRFILPVVMPIKFILTPLLVLPKIFLKREEERQAAWRQHEASEEEIETFIDEAAEEGIIEKDQNELLRGVVEFGDQQVREIMTPRSRMVAVEIETTVGQLKQVFIREKYSRIPVYKERLDNIFGVVMAKDLLEFSDPSQDGRKIDFLLRPAVFVPETMPVKKLLKEFKKIKQKLAIVVDEYGGVSGLVTMEDLLEEIVGEIQDEYDTEEPQIIAEKPESYLVSGETAIEDLEEVLGTELSEDNFLTVNGLLHQHLGRLPRRGEKLELANLSFEVLEVDDKSIKKVRLTRQPTGNKTGEEK
ncbi:MAG: hemolysin family protein [Candidatus Saccharicenans sp.]|uniref:hemolysin family protein n=1 Tax=Candidatus Saccharicenans sp. TaxID=2819258 RepID=UPI00404B0316